MKAKIHRREILAEPHREGICQKSCDHCAAQKMVCTIAGIWVSNQKWWERLGEGLQPRKKSQVEVESDAQSEGSGTGSWKQEVSSTLLEIKEF